LNIQLISFELNCIP